MSQEFRDNPKFKPWGPFISPKFESEPITQADIIIATVVWFLTVVNSVIALWLGYAQTKGSRSPLRSTYVWMIWIELAVCFVMGLECYLHLHKIIYPSFAFYFTILFWWCIQVQLLLQIIINRIRIIVPDRRRSRWIMIGTAVVVTAINISVFNIWIPARLQTNATYIHVNEIWDRIEKVIYLLIDAALNWYFLKVVKQNLISNGLQKYNKLLRFNQRIIILSLLMDVMIIAAMSIPNSFVYIQFHPLAYLVKLNIEMTMANLIKRIAISTSRRTGNASIVDEFNSSSNLSSTARSRGTRKTHDSTLIELSNVFSFKSSSNAKKESRAVVSFAPTGNQIKATREIYITNEPNPDYMSPRSHTPDTKLNFDLETGDRTVVKSKSMESVTNTEGGESVKSDDGQKRGDSDDEVALVIQGKKGWGRLPD